MLISILITLVLFIATLISVWVKLPLIVVFILIIATLVKTSHLLGNATEELANYYSATIGGLMNATLGNLTEIVVGFFALSKGLVDVVKASIAGSIIGNLLFVFGMAVFVGSFRKKELVLKKHEAEISSTMLLICVLLLLFPSLLFIFHEEAYVMNISIAVAIALVSLYLLSLVFSLYTHKNLFLSKTGEKPSMKKTHAILIMLFSVVILLVVGEMFAGRIEEIAHKLHFGELFIGAFLVGLAGNAAEHLGALQFAIKNKMSLVLNTTIGSSLQLAMFVTPLLVFISYFTGHFMNLAFLPVEIFAILASVLLINEIARDGAVNWLEGVQLMLLYLIIGVVFFFLP